MLYFSHDITHALDGINTTKKELKTYTKEAEAIVADCMSRKSKGEFKLLGVPELTNDLEELEKLAHSIRENFHTVVVLGTGGSSLSGQALSSIARNKSGPAILFVDNVDPDVIDPLLKVLDYKNTCFLVISKSGKTLETLTQMAIFLKSSQRVLSDKDLKDHFLVITDPGSRPLRQIAQKYGIKVIPHLPEINGRFAILTNVGLLPALIVGLDASALREGAKNVAEDPSEAIQGAAIQMLLMQNGITANVLMAYSDVMKGFVRWFRQIWAESLGKDGKGNTPINAWGTLDQHGQLQLYLDGPRDKFITILTLERKSRGVAIDPKYLPDNLAKEIKQKTLGDIMDAEQRATIETVINNKLPLRHIHIPELNERSIGALLMHFMLETIITGHLLNVNPFDQPAVEESKRLAHNYLSQKTS